MMNPAEHWRRLSVGVALYYAAFAVAAGSSMVQLVIWGGGGILAFYYLLVVLEDQGRFRVPNETILLAVFLFWGLLGYFNVRDFQPFSRYLFSIAQMVIIVMMVAETVRRSGSTVFFYWALVVTAVVTVFSLLNDLQGLGLLGALTEAESWATANAFGFTCTFGIVGVLGLVLRGYGKMIRVGLVCAAAICLYGVVLSGSRGAFLATCLVVVLWPLFSLGYSLKQRVYAAIVLVGVVLIFALFLPFIMEQTNLGRRLDLLSGVQDTSSQSRLEMFLVAFKIFIENPVQGVGLGQFKIVSGHGMYAHNEIAEILSSAGLIGALLYYAAFALTWRRLSNASRLATSAQLLYEINMAKIVVLILLFSGVVFRINFLQQDTMFVYAFSVGVSLWTYEVAKQGRRVGRAGFSVHEPNAYGSFTGRKRD